MPIISPTQVVAGSEIKASDVNNPINTIANLVNGNLDSANLAANAVTTPNIAPNAVTADNIDFATMPRQWRVVAEGGQNTVIPAGYNDYRIRLYCNVSAPSTQSNTVLRLSNKSGAAYLTGVRSYGTTLDTGTFTIPSGGNAIAYLTESNSVSLSIFATIELHVREGTNSIVGFVNSSGVGKDWYIASKLDFALPSLNNLGDLSVTRTGSTVSNVEFIIEALV